MDHNVVHTMIHQVCADRSMQAHLKSYLEFGAHSVRTGDQDRIAILAVQGKKSTEAANVAQNVFGEGFMGEIFDSFLGPVRAVDINTGIRVSNSGGVFCRILSHSGQPLCC